MDDIRLDAERRGATRDALLYGASAIHALGISIYPVHSIYRAWGRVAVWFYAAGAVAAGVIRLARPVRSGSRGRARLALALLVLAGAALAPVVTEVILREQTNPSRHAQSHTIITEEAARALLDGMNPYSADYSNGPLATWEAGVRTHFPYMPGMIVFGLARGAWGPSALTDARNFFVVGGLAIFAVAAALFRTSRDRWLAALQVLVVLPTGAVFLSGGGHELPVLALMLMSLVLHDREQYVASGFVLGAAAAIKQTAWILIPFWVVAVFRRAGSKTGAKSAAALSAIALPIILPFLLWDPPAFVEDTVRFPLDIGTEQTIARGPTLGRLLLETFPSARPWLSFALLGTIGVIATLVVVRLPPQSASATALYPGIMFALAILVSTAGRPGYAIYPINLLLWSWILRTHPSNER